MSSDRRAEVATVAGAPDHVAGLFRCWGYLQAQLDPLQRLAPQAHAELDAVPPDQARAWREIYCGSIGIEFMHIPDPEVRGWIAARMESPPPPVDRDRILDDILRAEVFERFLQARYVGTKRYSLEGSAALISLLNHALDHAADHGTEIALIAMSHRGRLTVMLETVGVPAASLFAGFADFDPKSVLGGGDVKYHLGATGVYRTQRGKQVDVHLVSNPSHLEAVNPVVMGRVRARQQRLGAAGKRKVLGITIHGDAAFAGQGMASETLNLAGIAGFSVGGTLQIIVNNLIGFTTEPAALHSSRYSSDLAHRLPVPILHVNGEDPEAVVRAAGIAVDFRDRFGTDVVVDLIGYRRYGHSEVDDPTTTQPLLYRRIESRPRLWEQYAQVIGKPPDAMATRIAEIEAGLAAEQAKGRAAAKIPVLRTLPAYWDAYVGGCYVPAFEVETSVPRGRLLEIATRMTKVPPGFTVHPKVLRLLEQRLDMAAGKRAVDWAAAEALAFGSLLWDGVPVRMSGQDTCRGTFNQRHAVLIDFDTGKPYVPLDHLHAGQARFDIHNSTLSEAAELGFAYGYSRDYPDALVCWEAQFGDFVNGAQVIIDQFISAAEDKWGLLSGIVMLLPHGYEGQGPEHSSARLERFLQLAGNDNIQVCQPSTAAQYFHLLRRQVLRRWRKPLVVLTPKGMLRSAAAASDVQDLAGGQYRNVLPDDSTRQARRVLVCSGKVAHELRAERARRQRADVAIVTLEQLYPFPEADLEAALAAHAGATEVVWVQEEPANMGALFFARPILQRLAAPRPVTAVRRSASASPATGSPGAHGVEQRVLLDLAFAK